MNVNNTNRSIIGETYICVNDDCENSLKNVKDNSIQSIVIDPPYNIKKDTWDDIDNYIEYMTNIVKILQTKLKNNGSFFIFHNNMETISELMVSIKKNTRLKFRQMITWNKRWDTCKKKGFLDGYIVREAKHNWEKMCEYILFYTFDNHELIRKKRKEKSVSQKTISQEILSKTGGLTGWFSNIELGLNYPTRETIVPITKHIGINYDDIVPKFNNLKKDHSVWNYEIAKKASCHLTPKPIDLLENIILHTTDEGDCVLDCFAGTGSLLSASLNTKRKCILIEREEKYFNFIKNSVLK